MASALIKVDGLERTYRMGAAEVGALRGVGLEIGLGEFVAIMGPSGSGKSTLMNLLGFLDRPTGGSYRFAGVNVGRLGENQRAEIRNVAIGFVFQFFNLLNRNTALENVELPLVYRGVAGKERRRRAEAALSAVGLTHRKDHWPRQLSGGEQQRIAIARALVGNPALILADEPTGALDVRTGLEILALFQRLNRGGRTIIMVTHEAEVARHAGRMVSMRDGRVIADESVADPQDAAAQLALMPALDQACDMAPPAQDIRVGAAA